MTLRLRYVVNVDAKQGLAVVFFNKIIIYIVKTFQTAERQYAQCFNAVIELKKKKKCLRHNKAGRAAHNGVLHKNIASR